MALRLFRVYYSQYNTHYIPANSPNPFQAQLPNSVYVECLDHLYESITICVLLSMCVSPRPHHHANVLTFIR